LQPTRLPLQGFETLSLFLHHQFRQVIEIKNPVPAGFRFAKDHFASIVTRRGNLAGLVRDAGMRRERRWDHRIEALLQKNVDGEIAARL